MHLQMPFMRMVNTEQGFVKPDPMENEWGALSRVHVSAGEVWHPI